MTPEALALCEQCIAAGKEAQQRKRTSASVTMYVDTYKELRQRLRPMFDEVATQLALPWYDFKAVSIAVVQRRRQCGLTLVFSW